MKESTDLRGLKSMAISLLYTDIHKTDFSPLVVTHPFTNSGIVSVLKDGERKLLDITQSEEDEQLWRSGLAKEIREAQTPVQIFTMINKPYLLTFMKFAEPYLSRKDFSGMFGEAWITSEAPHQDVNVSKEESVTFFKQCDAEVLMEEDERELLADLSDPLTIYRGVTSHNADTVEALSWSLSRNTADWFAHRFGEEGRVFEAKIDKENVLALFSVRGEQEVIVDPKHLYDIQESFEETETFNFTQKM